ncbi:reverse transcriptase domain-containing protein, partial [Tanacetum coccineum]
MPASDAALQEYCDKNYHQLLPIIAEKGHRAEEGTLEKGSDLDVSAARPEALSQSAANPNPQGKEFRKEKRCSKDWRRVYSTGLEIRGRSSHSRETEFASEKHHNKRASLRRTKALSESEGSAGGHWKSKSKRKKSSIEKDDLSQAWVCKETYPFTPRIRYFDFPKTRMPSHIKTYDESEDPEDHLKIFQATVKTEHWAMPTWCHMFNSTLIGNARVWFDDLPQESIDSYDDLKKTFLENYLQQKKCIKDPVEIHNIKQRDGECKDVKGAPECMKIL